MCFQGVKQPKVSVFGQRPFITNQICLLQLLANEQYKHRLVVYTFLPEAESFNAGGTMLEPWCVRIHIHVA